MTISVMYNSTHSWCPALYNEEPKMDPLRIRLALKQIRRSRNLTAKDLSERAGVAGYLVSRIESGKTQLDFLTAIKLTGALQVSLEEFASVARSLPDDVLSKAAEVSKLREKANRLARDLGGPQ